MDIDQKLEALFDASDPGPDVDGANQPEQLTAAPTHYSSGDIARRLGEKFYRVTYVLKVRDIRPMAIVAGVRIFDQAAFNHVRREIALLNAERETQ